MKTYSKSRVQAKPTKSSSHTVWAIPAAVLTVLIYLFILNQMGSSASETPKAEVVGVVANAHAAPSSKHEPLKGPGLTFQEMMDLVPRGPQNYKLFNAIAQSGHPYMRELTDKLKARKVGIIIQVPPAQLEDSLESEAQFDVQQLSDGSLMKIIFVNPSVLGPYVSDSFLQRKLVHEYHHLREYDNGMFNTTTGTGAQELINILMSEIPAWIAECEYSVNELKYLRDEHDICRWIIVGGRLRLAQAVTQEIVDKYYGGKFRPYKTDAIRYVMTTRF